MQSGLKSPDGLLEKNKKNLPLFCLARFGGLAQQPHPAQKPGLLHKDSWALIFLVSVFAFPQPSRAQFKLVFWDSLFRQQSDVVFASTVDSHQIPNFGSLVMVGFQTGLIINTRNHVQRAPNSHTLTGKKIRGDNPWIDSQRVWRGRWLGYWQNDVHGRPFFDGFTFSRKDDVTEKEKVALVPMQRCSHSIAMLSHFVGGERIEFIGNKPRPNNDVHCGRISNVCQCVPKPDCCVLFTNYEVTRGSDFDGYPRPLDSSERHIGLFECPPLEPSYQAQYCGKKSDAINMTEWRQSIRDASFEDGQGS